MTPTIGCVLLTMGDRPAEVQRAVDSVRDQVDPPLDVVVVVNADPGAAHGLEVAGARVVHAGANIGIPAGRNLGLAEVAGDLVFFLDDDAWLTGPDVLAAVVERFMAEPDLAVLSLRVVDEHGNTQRRHVPRLRVGDPSRSSEVTTFLGGASVVRRTPFQEVGGLPEEFFYSHEETSLGWRLVAAGWRLRYDGALTVGHPRTVPGRHAMARRLSARNRVLLARRHLPWPLAVLYPLLWGLLTLVRDPGGAVPLLRGTFEGLRMAGVPREPIPWRAVWRLTRRGRPPLL